MKVYHSSLIGKRETNEDQHQIIINDDNNNSNINNINFFAVYDGHGGGKVSKFLKNNLSQYFLKKNIKYPLSDSYIIKVFNHLQKKLSIDHKDFAYSQGSTCLLSIIYSVNKKKYLHLINLGDCRAVMCSNDIAKCLSKDHKPDWPDEKKRITELGGEIYFDGVDYRVASMSVSRSFGDLDATPYITHSPDIYKYRINSNDKFIIMACDGLWDALTNQDAINFVLDRVIIEKNKNKYEINLKDKRKNLAKSLAEYAIKKGSYDNITVIIVFL